MSLILYPLSCYLDNKDNPEQIVFDHSDQQWEKLVNDMIRIGEQISMICGISVEHTERYGPDFVRIFYKITNRPQLSRYISEGSSEKLTICSLYSHYLGFEDRPSFFNQNIEDGKMLLKFVLIG